MRSLTLCVSSVHDGTMMGEECMLEGGVGGDWRASLHMDMERNLRQLK